MVGGGKSSNAGAAAGSKQAGVPLVGIIIILCGGPKGKIQLPSLGLPPFGADLRILATAQHFFYAITASI